ncbi:FecCD family ABC transporter permease [Corynebacterium ulcerans]|nr:iron ABC transporter permease [Corynebacterium ulcerans]AIU31448.1 ABC-type cobalamin/Fe3+-siderophores transport system, permease component [Corynebacterium ulcerans]AIU92713.1 ABC-type cobalamin/Fe3+-siderophores transport system, permease component [Corynebacterium ulcerans]KPH74139.1 ABC transporter permease [Corynebacterium ulcerans]MBH5296263.1 iron ABC transporter permease [Corynebacterium ulcerans]MBL4944910.1 iron ABC transporter permease [Corynebacterium ulcerans]
MRERNVTLFSAIIVLSMIVLGCVVIAAALVGAVGIGPDDVLRELLGGHVLSERHRAIVLNVRLPRIVLAVIVGAMLSIAGAAYQAVFHNPLADPYLLGVSAGAGLGVTLAVVFGATIGFSLGGAGIIGAAFMGGVAAVAVTCVCAGVVGGQATSSDATTVVLAGVAVAACASAAQTFVQQRNIDTIQRIYAWMLGSLNTAGWSTVGLVILPVAACVVLLCLSVRLLDVMTLGDEEAAALGVHPQRARLMLVGVATLGTSVVVAVSGLIGFVGIIVPHAVRLVVGPAHRRLIPVSVIWGGIFLLAADTAGRTAMAPAELPVGVVTAFVGAPFFLVVLHRHRRGRS